LHKSFPAPATLLRPAAQIHYSGPRNTGFTLFTGVHLPAKLISKYNPVKNLIRCHSGIGKTDAERIQRFSKHYALSVFDETHVAQSAKSTQYGVNYLQRRIS
jgi:hypothetical protein